MRCASLKNLYFDTFDESDNTVNLLENELVLQKKLRNEDSILNQL